MIRYILASIAIIQVALAAIPDVGDSALGRRVLSSRNLLECAAKWKQCGGKKWTGTTCCASGLTCQATNEWYSSCRTGGKTFEEPAQLEKGPDDSNKKKSNPPTKSSPPPPSNGKYTVCFDGDSKKYGPTVEQREWKDQGSAVTITRSGKCSWEEYAGGFDGYPSPEVGDGHEKGMDMAIEQMFPNDRSTQNSFLQAMIAIAKPIDLDHPKDVDRANNGERMRNIGKLNYACSQLISVSC